MCANALFWLGLFEILLFFLMFQDMNCGAQTCLFTYLHAAAGRVYSIEFLQLNHFSSELEGVVLYKMTDKVHGIHQFGNKWSRLLPKTNKSSVMEFSSFVKGMEAKIFYKKK